MKSPMKQRTALLMLAVLCCAPLIAVIAGCSDNAKPTAAEGYYSGPMEGKGKKAGNAKSGTTE